MLALVGRAISNREIAEILHLSEGTVKTHLNRLMAKLGLSNRAQVVALAYDCGLVTACRRRFQGELIMYCES
ncbi:response regulator transcription factor [Nonomuraea sp. NPDC059007]|uniref:response regulator transcription factor n=1 Tax=Nonomuraea sp. NPDC059007 TaxID=3346692 RepID=UPI0036A977A0